MIHPGNTGREGSLPEIVGKFGIIIKRLVFAQLFCFAHYKGN